ncbi:hypothetical protein AUJ84_01185 [Candidatus Pacearchaeota archaeon CG1_02_32_132]|nr:MAG: hypothetical protein AUJ84_01185 [Candidatus Pacearchaeota archaeon CG1_02_32_132]
MENKNVGYILLGISALIIIIIFLFNSAMTKIVYTTCSAEHGPSCPMYESIDQQTYLSLAIVGLVILIALILIFSKPQERIIIKKVKERQKKTVYDLSGLKAEEKKVFSTIQENKTIFQADLIEKTGFGKAKITRILDRLEGHKLIERKRRGMTNVVVLKE